MIATLLDGSTLAFNPRDCTIQARSIHGKVTCTLILNNGESFDLQFRTETVPNGRLIIPAISCPVEEVPHAGQ